ncbi:alpha/beta hydrolase [Rhodovibrio salinarum]|uniref:Alpha/beta hydrolase n=1 Tax=Rhodovibrio salinarum TaxID=1087 RepID=A0A934UYG1_9PROT|nr:alpha/beta hydrolase [Rhodovibrio salinarum]MBK1696087.1 alpha/beta hydrolase [Rhodovibrio salinarum]
MKAILEYVVFPLSGARSAHYAGRSTANVRRLVSLTLLLLLAACAPKTVPPGAATQQPRLADGALVMPDGARLPLESWLPDDAPEAAVVALHGFNDYAHAFALPGRWFAQHGIALYAYDQRGFGRTDHAGLWPGTDALVADARTAARLIRQRHPDTPVYLMGASMGGAVILATAGRGDLGGADGAVLAAPAVWAISEMPFYQRAALWLTAYTVPWMTLSGAELDRLPSDNIPMLRQFSRDPLVISQSRVDAIYGLTQLMGEALAAAPALQVPTLALYGRRDEIVPPQPTEKLWRRIPEGQTRALYGTGWHMMLRDLHAPTVWRDIRAWIVQGGQGPLPSGADAKAEAALEQDGLQSRPRPKRIRAGVE